MLSRTLREYEENYPIDLQAFLMAYEDNTERLFLEKEYVKYSKSDRAMLKILDRLKKLPIDERSNTELFFNLGNNLREANERAYKDIVTSIRDYPKGSRGPAEPLAVKVNYEKLENLITSSTLILKFITDKLIPQILASKTDESEKLISSTQNIESDLSTKSNDISNLPEPIRNNPFLHIFADIRSFELFDRLYTEYKDSKTPLADFSFIYRKMFNEGFILAHFKPQMFIDWISNKPYCIQLSKIKTMNDCTTKDKIKTYATIKELIQQKK